MLEVVADAVHRLGRDEWWSEVHGALDGLTQSEVDHYQAEAAVLGVASTDGLDDH